MSNIEKVFITKMMKVELAILHKLAMGKYIHTWGYPTLHLVGRPANAHAWGDYSLFSGSAFSLDRTFWWHLAWPKKIQRLTLNQLK